MVIESSTVRSSRHRPTSEFSEIMGSATRGDVAMAWAVVCAIALVALILV